MVLVQGPAYGMQKQRDVYYRTRCKKSGRLKALRPIITLVTGRGGLLAVANIVASLPLPASCPAFCCPLPPAASKSAAVLPKWVDGTVSFTPIGATDAMLAAKLKRETEKERERTAKKGKERERERKRKKERKRERQKRTKSGQHRRFQVSFLPIGAPEAKLAET